MSQKTRKSEPVRPAQRPPGSPRTEDVTAAIPACVPVPLYADDGPGRTTVLRPPLIVAAPVAGSYGIRGPRARKSTGAGA
ncbi:hypothetical protein ACWEN3_22010 [Streptomyces sp. NPDC004561]